MSLFSAIVFVLSLTPDYHLPKRRILRGSLFLLIGICAGLPIFHLIIFHKHVNGFDHSPKYHYWYLGGIIYVLGGVIYVRRIPEKYRPGKHDYLAASHQFLHLCVNVGVILHYLGSIDSYYYRLNSQCPSNEE